MVPPMTDSRRGIHLEYGFTPDATQRGAAIANPLVDLLRTLRDSGSISAAARWVASGVNPYSRWIPRRGAVMVKTIQRSVR